MPTGECGMPTGECGTPAGGSGGYPISCTTTENQESDGDSLVRTSHRTTCTREGGPTHQHQRLHRTAHEPGFGGRRDIASPSNRVKVEMAMNATFFAHHGKEFTGERHLTEPSCVTSFLPPRRSTAIKKLICSQSNGM